MNKKHFYRLGRKQGFKFGILAVIEHGIDEDLFVVDHAILSEGYARSSTPEYPALVEQIRSLYDQPYNFFNPNECCASIETIDAFDTKKEAEAMLHQYRKAYHGDTYCYVSKRSTKAWREG